MNVWNFGFVGIVIGVVGMEWVMLDCIEVEWNDIDFVLVVFFVWFVLDIFDFEEKIDCYEVFLWMIIERLMLN